jgi:hypothetical protein
MKLAIVSMALCKPNGYDAEASRVRTSGEIGSPPVSYVMTLAKEKVMAHRCSWDGLGPR